MTLPGFITRNFRLKLACTVMAMITWVGVVYAGNPPETRNIDIPVPQSPADIPAQFVLVGHVPDISVRIGGGANHLNTFNVSALSVSAAWKTVAHAGTVTVPITIANTDSNVDLIDPPTSITAELDNLSSTTLAVTVRITNPPPVGYVTSSIASDPSSVVVAGAQHQLPGLEAGVTVDLGNRKTNVQADLPVLIYDSRGSQVSDLSSVNPTTVRVTITVSASQASRASAVVPRTVGSVGAGHELTGISVDPATVVLSGPQDLVNALDSIATTTISLAGLTGTNTFTVSLTPPDGVTAQPGTVTVTIVVIALPAPTPTPTPTPS
ncbi:MAG: hypothetical protein JOY80_07775, partial [Candidatus Dormibacteraeota bacterium]|nr:hypothetical protein [Candidatus Dormibacteraeota bacterium]